MKEVGYNDINRHTDEHEYFLQRANDLKQNNVAIDDEQCQKLVIFLGEWLLHHIITEDKKITHWFPTSERGLDVGTSNIMQLPIS
jgi:hemerythrin-like metal-binding protein